MAYLFPKLQFLFINILFVQVLLCTEELNSCSKPIKIYNDIECIHRLEDIQSHVRVYCNATLATALYKNVTNYQIRPIGVWSRKTSVNLVAYPILIPGSPRYRAHFCIEVSCEDLSDVDFMLLVFSTREGNDFVLKSAVVHHRIKSKANNCGKYVRIGCYWHYTFLLATSEITVHLEVILLKRNGSASNGKYYFRIPFWEQFNSEKEVDPCSFTPFAYAEESEESRTEVVTVRSVNCSRSAFVTVEQRKESSGEILQIELIRIDELGRGHTRIKDNKSLHYYEASFSEKVFEEIKEDVKDESSSTGIILISVLMLAVFIIVLALGCQQVFAFTSRHSVLFLREKPRVKFLYCRDSKFQIYRRMAETLILFMEKYCDIIVSDDSTAFHEAPKASFLPKKFDVIVLIPFPAIGGNYSDDSCTVRSIKQWEGTKKDCVIMELPFWSGNNAELEELCDEFEKWKRFTLMDEFLPLLTHIQRSSCLQRMFFSPVSSAEIQRKLEENNLTNDGFEFCLKEAFGNVPIEPVSWSSHGLTNLQEMEM